MGYRAWIAGASATTLLLGAGLANAQQPQPAPKTTTDTTLASLSAGDRQFIMDAVRGSEREVELGDLAKEKAQNSAVREFGARMAQDHARAGQELKALAASKGIRVGDTKKTGQEPAILRLTKLSSAQFDKEYVSAMVLDHEKDVAKFRRMSQQLQDPDLKAWATKTLPTLEDHLKTVKGLQSKVVGSTR
jgi:putative membrane protein